MKFFFMSSFTTEEGVEIMGQHAMLKLKEIVDNEDKTSPYSDDQLAAEMKNAGFPIARRTVAKYRDRLHIPEKRLRKQKK
jgi:RNA polymerase sigma-54 factor